MTRCREHCHSADTNAVTQSPLGGSNVADGSGARVLCITSVTFDQYGTPLAFSLRPRAVRDAPE